MPWTYTVCLADVLFSPLQYLSSGCHFPRLEHALLCHFTFSLSSLPTDHVHQFPFVLSNQSQILTHKTSPTNRSHYCSIFEDSGMILIFFSNLYKIHHYSPSLPPVDRILIKATAALVGNCWALQNGSHILLSSELSCHHSGLDATRHRRKTGMAKWR